MIKKQRTPIIEAVQILDYTGQIDHKIIDQLLKKLKKRKEFIKLDRITGKRVYSILEECLENIASHSEKKYGSNFIQPEISITSQKDKIVIKAANTVSRDKTALLEQGLNLINNLDEKDLKTLYDQKINTELKTENYGAGLGFMLMKLKSGHNIEYTLKAIDSNFSYFEIQISVNEYIMRKLIIDRTSYSPKVIFHPEKNIYEISGESRPPDVSGFYQQILDWLNDYSLYLSKSRAESDTIEFNLDFEYFNSSSAKYILDFCKKIANMRIEGKNVNIKWHYEADDTDMLEAGETMSRIARFPFLFNLKE